MRTLAIFALCGAALAAPTFGQKTSTEDPATPHRVEVVEGWFPFHRQGHYDPFAMGFEELTHVGHAFLWPEENGELKLADRFFDTTVNRAAHQAGARILACIGGFEHSEPFTTLAADPASRARFATRMRFLINQRDYDGVELHWLFPQSAADRDNLTELVREVRARIGPEASLHVALPPTSEFGRWFAVDIVDEVDRFPLLAFNIHGSWDGSPYHNAPLFPGSSAPKGSVASAVDYWTGRGFPAHKLVLGLPFYGRAFFLDGVENDTDYMEATAGTYREIRGLIGQGFQRNWDATSRVPFLVSASGRTLWSYDDAESLRHKAEFVLDRRLGGVAFWELTQDWVDDRHELLPAVVDLLR